MEQEAEVETHGYFGTNAKREGGARGEGVSKVDKFGKVSV